LVQFDWPGTIDPSPWLCVSDAIEFLEGLDAGLLMRRNHDLAVVGAKLLAERWGTGLPAPEFMLGAMAAVALPVDVGRAATREAAEALRDEIYDADRIEVQISAFADRLWARISMQAYNDLADVEALAGAISRRIRD
jgi:isopenicillin-N epimerase